MKKVGIVGAGLGGLVTAALLAKRGNQVVVMERAPIPGGRSHVVSKNGFTMSYGAHAVLAPKQEPMRSIIRELELPMEYRKASLAKFKLLKEGKVISSPLGFGALTSPAISGLFNHVKCLKQFYEMVKQAPTFPESLTVGQWIRDNISNPEIAKVLSAYASLSVYDGALDLYSMNRFVELTAREYEKNEPLSYMGYDILLRELQKAITNNGGTIQFGKPVSDLIVEADRVKGVVCAGERIEFDEVVLNVPPKELGKLLSYPSLADEFGEYVNQTAHYVYIYDLMLSKRIRGDIGNLLDLDGGFYINDYGINNPSAAPAGGQLINGLKFLTEQEQQDDSHAKGSQAAFEALLHRVYPGWEQYVVHKRMINRAMVGGIARRTTAKLLPLQSRTVRGLYLVGDATVGSGALGMPCYDSARKVADMIS
ncbi:phytoene dehydrogenase-like protein [Paenibacillus phyllosphaerae]|uniref:Phytoene dehydrogenase-like protein n=1 Tax=Paenibacillus phyllosphaerae TaxID=274593 RepID=A0A7W5FKJ4_9BACL|nr:FAD-dependent oxidoreductase [Paenibacillus phyllosphaerae]MBB3107982.1 phytoene dehydrogenase-like protein [Paenibacillus phyllosphaerae]